MVDEWRGGKPVVTGRKVVVLVAALAALSAAGWYGLQAWLVHKGKTEVRAQLKDPESARFELVAHYPSTGATCGAVNARNSFGGYVGFRGFVLERNGRLTFSESKGDPGVGTTEQRLEAVQKAIKFRELLDQMCPGIDE